MKYLVTIIIIFIYTTSDAQGLFNKIYERPYWNYADGVIERSDGNIFVLGSSRNPTNTAFVMILSLIDSEGNLIWDQYFETAREGSSIMKASDNNFLAVGTARNSSWDAYLVKFDLDGNMIWEQSYPSPDWVQGYSVGETSDNNYYFVGSAEYISNLYLTDSEGNLIWSNSYPDVELFSVAQTSDGGFILTGNTYDPDHLNMNIVLLKVDSDGNEIWSKLYGDGGYDSASSVIQLPNGGFMIAGEYDDPWEPDDPPRTYLIRTSTIGDTIWTKKHGGGPSQHIRMLNNGDGFIHSSSEIWANVHLSFSITKLDNSGDRVWYRRFDNSQVYTVGNNITETQDGSFLLTGAKNNWPYDSDQRLIKLDSLGNYVLSVDDFRKEQSHLILYPNPSTNKITFQLDSSDDTSIKELSVFNSSGKTIKNIIGIDKEINSIDVSEFANGIYFFKLITYSNQVIAGKFIVDN